MLGLGSDHAIDLRPRQGFMKHIRSRTVPCTGIHAARAHWNYKCTAIYAARAQIDCVFTAKIASDKSAPFEVVVSVHIVVRSFLSYNIIITKHYIK